MPNTKSFQRALCLCVLMALAQKSVPLHAQAPSAGTGPLKLTVVTTGLRSGKGEVAVALFAGAAGFPLDTAKAVRAKRAKIDGNQTSSAVVFEGLTPGIYAVAVFHDENSNNKLDKNLFGVPTEGYGASNHAARKMAQPSFQDAKFSLDQSDTITVHLVY